MTAAVYFFGAWAPDNIGHFLYLQSGRHAVGTIDHVVTQAMLALCPARCGHYDSMLPPQFPDHVTYEPDQPTDVGAVHHTGRYSVLAWWDRGGDNRRNSNSAIIVEADEPLNFDGLILVALAKFPHLTARLPAREYTA